jgi:histidinol-phosphatase (PHP family)
MHIHTVNSPDASMTEDELAGRAVTEGLAGIGFVAHVDFHPGDSCTGGFDPAAYDGAVESAAAAHPCLAVMKGVEIGEPHRFMDRALEVMAGREYDFVTGALHWVGDRFTLEPGAFLAGDPLELVEEYLRETLAIVEGCAIDILAHFGLWRRGLHRADPGRVVDEFSAWPGLVRRILDTMAERGIALEMNTSGLRRPEGVTYPIRRVAEEYRRLGGRLVTLGSDTHSAGNAFFGLSSGARVLLEAGFTEAFGYTAGRPFPYPLAEAALPPCGRRT